MATFGTFPGVKVTTTGGGVTGVAIGREQNLIIVGNGDAGSGNASVNTATQIGSSTDADTQFGSDTELANAMQYALANDANIDFMYGIMFEEITVTDESVSQSDTLANTPIVEDTSLITATDSGGTDPSVEFRYDSPPSTPSSSDTAFINPSTGEIEFDAAADNQYEIDYSYPDWSSAFTEAETVIDVEENGIIVALTEAGSVASTLTSSLSTLRNDYKMALGLSGAEHNANTDDDDAEVDASTYTDSIDDESYFLAGPVRLVDTTDTVLGAVGGLMAGAALTDSIYDEPLQGLPDDLEQHLSKSNADDLRDEEVIPIRQTQANSPIVVEDNLSTSTSTDWTRDFYTIRIVDDVTLIAKALGDTIIGRINSEENRTAVEDAIRAEIRDLVRDDLVKANTSDTDNWSVDVYEESSNANQVNIDIGITPTGITKRADVTITINTS